MKKTRRQTEFSLTVKCECGCGLPTPLARDTIRSRGIVSGQPLRCRVRHHSRLKPARSYRMTSSTGQFELVHRVRAAAALGKPLPFRAVVHHADGSRTVDSPLVICENQAYHILLHVRTRIVRAGGNPNTDGLCKRCGPKPREAFGRQSSNKSTGLWHMCRDCNSAVARRRCAS